MGSRIQIQNVGMEVLFEDESIIVVNKPAGIATQSKGVGVADLESECRKYRKRKGEAPEIYVVHRLDQPVSGILVFAKTKEAAAELTKNLKEDDFSKDYRAIVYKTKEIEPAGKLTDYMIKDGKTNLSCVVPKSIPGAKEAVLVYKVETEEENKAEIKVHLKTGRHHQIRVQLANAGMPILGDLKYGTKESIEYSKENGIKNVSLCAFHLEFDHPKTKGHMEFEI